jgi:uncharacterized protein YceH (UPF0502 family)
VDLTLEPIEIRVLGSLIEKKITTPEYYPLTLNGLMSACNQTTNRDPITTYDEIAISRALESLKQKGLVWTISGGRALKYDHRVGEKLGLEGRELAVMCVLMLRGPQTAGELRGRTGRLCEFASLGEVEELLVTMTGAEPALVIQLPRAPGAKERRYTHRLGGEPAAAGSEAAFATAPSAAPVPEGGPGALERIARLEREVAALRERVEELSRLLAAQEHPVE